MPITKERILRTLDRINAARDRAIGQQSNIISAFALHGLKLACHRTAGTELPAIETQRVDLEANYLDAPRTRLELEQTIEQWKAGLDRFHRKTEKVFEIQARHGISGLIEHDTSLGGATFCCHWASDDLRLIPADLDILREEKASLVESWCDRTIFSQFQIYKDSDKGWQDSSISEVMAGLPFFDWVHVWENRHYSSSSRMRRYGYDDLREYSKYPDDRLHCEYHLFLGAGLDTESPVSYACFCACNEMPLH